MLFQTTEICLSYEFFVCHRNKVKNEIIKEQTIRSSAWKVVQKALKEPLSECNPKARQTQLKLCFVKEKEKLQWKPEYKKGEKTVLQPQHKKMKFSIKDFFIFCTVSRR